jgi:hypothetical protein
MKLLNRFKHNGYTVEIKQANSCMYYYILDDGEVIEQSKAYMGMDNYEECMQDARAKCDDLDGVNLFDLNSEFEYA